MPSELISHNPLLVAKWDKVGQLDYLFASKDSWITSGLFWVQRARQLLTASLCLVADLALTDHMSYRCLECRIQVKIAWNQKQDELRSIVYLDVNIMINLRKFSIDDSPTSCYY